MSKSCFNHRCYFRYGRSYAKLLSENGYKVYAGCRDKNIEKCDGNINYIYLDVTKN